MSQQSRSPVVGQRHPPEMRAVHVRNTVKLGETFVDERVVRGKQIYHASVVAQLALEEEVGLTLERVAQVSVEIGKQIGIGRKRRKVSKVEPLAGKIGDERL